MSDWVREGWKEGEKGKEEGREGGRKGGREKGREKGREGGRVGGRWVIIPFARYCTLSCYRILNHWRRRESIIATSVHSTRAQSRNKPSPCTGAQSRKQPSPCTRVQRRPRRIRHGDVSAAADFLVQGELLRRQLDDLPCLHYLTRFVSRLRSLSSADRQKSDRAGLGVAGASRRHGLVNSRRVLATGFGFEVVGRGRSQQKFTGAFLWFAAGRRALWFPWGRPLLGGARDGWGPLARGFPNADDLQVELSVRAHAVGVGTAVGPRHLDPAWARTKRRVLQQRRSILDAGMT